MKAAILGNLIKVMIGMLDENLLRGLADMILAFAEKYVLGTASTIDDDIVLPICDVIRKTFHIPKTS